MRHQEKAKSVKLTDDIKRQVGRLEQEGIIKLHHETVYPFILEDKKADGTLYKHLRHQGKTYRKRYGSALDILPTLKDGDSYS